MDIKERFEDFTKNYSVVGSAKELNQLYCRRPRTMSVRERFFLVRFDGSVA